MPNSETQTPKPAVKAPSRLKNALCEGYNTVGLSIFFAASLAALNPTPAVIGVILEIGYIAIVPRTRWYEDRLFARQEREALAKREALKAGLYPQLSEDVRERFGRLEAARSQIGGQDQHRAIWYKDVVRKLDYLMEKFLLFAGKEVQFRNYLLTVRTESDSLVADGAPRPVRRAESRREIESDAWTKQTVSGVQVRYDGEAAAIEAMMQSDENLHNRSVLQKRKDILLRRKVYVGRIGEILNNLAHQGRLIEDTFGLINDEIRARSPEQVLADIEDVVDSTDVLMEAIQKVAPFEEMHAEA